MVSLVLVAAYYGVTCALWEITHGAKVRIAEVLTKRKQLRGERMKVASIETVDEILAGLESFSSEDYTEAMRLIRAAALEMDDKEVQAQIRAAERLAEEEWYE
jgi:hypothetical protein